MTALSAPLQERLTSHLEIQDYDGAAKLVREAYPVARDEDQHPLRAEAFHRILSHAMDQADDGHIPTNVVLEFVQANRHELPAASLGDIVADPNWSWLFDRSLVID